MTTHIMNLNPQALSLIKSGSKTIEMRLFDEKRRKIVTGDIIKFISTKDSSTFLTTQVTKLYVFKNFKELYQKFDKIKLGYMENDIPNYSDMEKYYSQTDMKSYGVVGIEIKVI